MSQVSDFGSGHDLRVREFEPHIELCVVSEEPTSDFLPPSLFLSLSAPTLFAWALPFSLKNE